MEGGSLKTRWTFCDRLLLISVYQCLLNTWGEVGKFMDYSVVLSEG